MMADKVKCKYWDKCYRTDPAHKKQFLHPSPKQETNDEASAKDSSSDTNSPKKNSSEKVKLTGITLRGKTVVFTGILAQGTRKQVTARAISFGLKVKPAVSKYTDIVVVGEMPGKKLDIAEDHGIAVLTEEEWEELLKQSKPGKEIGKTKRSKANGGSDDEGTSTTKKQKRPETHDLSDSGESDTNENSSGTPRKTTLRRQKTHDFSDSEDDAEPPKKAKIGLQVPSSSPKPSPIKGKTPPMSPNKGKPPRCKYWNKCYRKDPAHLKAYHHPPVPSDDDAGEGTSSGGGDGPSGAATAGEVTPNNSMDVGETIEIGNYKIKRVSDHYYCTCMSWKNQSGPVNKRTCKHLKQHLGEKFEAKRCGSSSNSARSPVKTLSPVKIPQLLLAHKWDEKLDPAGWWMSEKLDGVRAYWNGKAFYSRLGNPFCAPQWFTKGLPTDLTLDGELFGGRGKFQSTVSVVKTTDSPDWKKITYQVFDIPCTGSMPFEKRMEKVKKYFDDNSLDHVVVVKQTKCKGKTDLEDELKRIIALGGEGVMIRQPGSQYEHKRSNTLLKYKKFYDAEARVIAHEPGKGRNAGKCGALRCEMACGKKFSCGSGLSDKDRSNPPKIGTIITYKFQEYTNDGIPRFPTYLGPRIDLNQPSDAVVPSKPTDD